jgi:hypothetical protein
MDQVTIQLIVSTVFILAGVLFMSISASALLTRDLSQPLSTSSVVFVLTLSAMPLFAGILVLAVLVGAV